MQTRTLPQFLRAAKEALTADDLDDAAAALEGALHLQKTSNIAASLARVHLKRNDIHAHDVAINTAIELEPGADYLRLRAALACPPMMTTRAEIDRLRGRTMERLAALQRRGLSIPNPQRDLPTLTYYFAYHGLNDRPLNEAVGSLLASSCPGLSATAPHLQRPREGGPKIRLGIFSPHLRDHTIGQLFRGTIAKLPADRFVRSVIFCDERVDDMAYQIASRADQVTLIPRNLVSARSKIASLNLDILLYLDIGMDTMSHWLAHSRLAWLQASTWGHPVTSGLPTIDAFFSLDDAEPDHDNSPYTERLITQPAPQFCYTAPRLVRDADPKALGLPSGRLYGCPQTLFKLHPDFDDILIDILDRDPAGTLVLHAGKTRAWKAVFLTRLEARSPGISKRIHWMSNMAREDYIACLASFAVMLDPMPFGGGNTTLEALAVGTPVVTLPPRLARGRLAYAFCRRLGWTDGIASDAADYARRAVLLAKVGPARTAAIAAIHAGAPRLFGNEEGVEQLSDRLASTLEEVIESGRQDPN